GASGEDISVEASEAEGYYRIPEFSSSCIDFLVKVKGTSMCPEYQNGDVAGVRKINDLTFFQWGKVYLLDTDRGAFIKRLYPCEENPDLIVCHSDNA
ncbi:MAG: peptidase S24, partial [Candidatus Nephrothrix sp. EaCA]